MRQTLLPFLSVSQKKPEAVAAPRLGSPRPALEVPVELWEIILEGLSTITLKTIRLVCRSWNQVATDRLFQTIYLDSYESSWRRFEQLVSSKYVHLATKIVWSPVVLYENCLDGEIWHSKYPNLLHGLSHSESLYLHKLFRQAYTETQQPKLPLRRYLDNLQNGELHTLVNCHQLIIVDDSDIETKCADKYFRSRVQSDPSLLKKPTVWGRSPQWWIECSENCQVFESVEDVFWLVQQTTTVSQVRVSMWDRHVDAMFNYRRPRLYHEGMSCIRSFNLQLKFCTVVNIDFDHPAIRPIMNNAFATLCELRNLQHLVFESVYTDAGYEFLRFYKQRQQEERLYSEDDDDASDSASQTSHTSTIHSTVSALDETSDVLPDGVTRDFLSANLAILDFPMLKLGQLKSLTLCTVTVSTKALIAWLCNQSQLPESGLTLQLQGPTILYGSCPHTFLRILAQLNVKIIYNARNTLWFSTDTVIGAVRPQYDDWGNRLEGKIKKGLYYIIDMVPGPYSWEVYDDAELHGPQQMLEQDTIRIQSSYRAKFVHRPWTIRYIYTSTGNDQSVLTYFYCLVRNRDQKYSFEWLNESEYRSRCTISVSGESEVELIISARAWTHRREYDEYYDDFHDLIQQEFDEAEAQAALLLYENELLRRDVFNSIG